MDVEMWFVRLQSFSCKEFTCQDSSFPSVFDWALMMAAGLINRKENTDPWSLSGCYPADRSLCPRTKQPDRTLRVPEAPYPYCHMTFAIPKKTFRPGLPFFACFPPCAFSVLPAIVFLRPSCNFALRLFALLQSPDASFISATLPSQSLDQNPGRLVGD